MCECVCVCLCVTNITKLQKDYIFKMSFFLWLETVGFSETGKSFIVNVYWRSECLRGPSMLLLFTPVDDEKNVALKRERVSAVKNLCKKEFEYDEFIENTCLGSGSKHRTIFTRGHSFTQVTWFSWPMVSPRLNMCVSAIFVVGTSGILPKSNYRSVKSYKLD